MSRPLALTTALAVALSGSGLPMCVSLVARAVQPCAMHEHARGHAGHGLRIVADHATGDACHGQDGDLGCVAGGTCPTGGVAAPLKAPSVLTTPDLARDVMPAIDRAYHSFLSPPLPPPPQA